MHKRINSPADQQDTAYPVDPLFRALLLAEQANRQPLFYPVILSKLRTLILAVLLFLIFLPCNLIAQSQQVEIGRYPTGLGAEAVGAGIIETVWRGPAAIHGNPAGIISVQQISLSGTTEFDTPARGFLRRRFADRSPNVLENIGRRHLQEPYQFLALKIPKLSIALGTEQTYVFWSRKDTPVNYPFTERKWGVESQEYEIVLAQNSFALAAGTPAAGSIGISVILPQARGRFALGTEYLPDDPLMMPDDISEGDALSTNSPGVACGVQKMIDWKQGLMLIGAVVERYSELTFAGPSPLPAVFKPPVRVGLGTDISSYSGLLHVYIEGVYMLYSSMKITGVDMENFQDQLQFKCGAIVYPFSFVPFRAGLAYLGPQRKTASDLFLFTYGTSLSFGRVTGLSSTGYFKDFSLDFAGTAPLKGNELSPDMNTGNKRRAVYSSGLGYFATASIVF